MKSTFWQRVLFVRAWHWERDWFRIMVYIRIMKNLAIDLDFSIMLPFFFASFEMYPNTKIGFDVMDMSLAFGKGKHRYRLIVWPFVFVVGNH